MAQCVTCQILQSPPYTMMPLGRFRLREPGQACGREAATAQLREFLVRRPEFMIYYWRFGGIGTCSFRRSKQISRAGGGVNRLTADMGSVARKPEKLRL